MYLGGFFYGIYTPNAPEYAHGPRRRRGEHGAFEKNVDGTLPLRPQGSEKLPVAVFGTGQVRTVFACPEFELYHTVSVLDGLAGPRNWWFPTASWPTSTGLGR